MKKSNHLDTKQLVFVYGTLLSSCENHKLLQLENDTKLVSKNCITSGKYFMVDCHSFSGLIKDTISLLTTGYYTSKYLKNIKGELYSVSDKTLNTLDISMGFPTFYSREQVKIEMLDRESYETKTAWIYYLVRANEDYKLISNNQKDYISYRKYLDTV
jgi:gamma-glutamylcyclotransferase (GGCT)/AIG2-like uncharacterized protein YtfP